MSDWRSRAKPAAPAAPGGWRSRAKPVPAVSDDAAGAAHVEPDADQRGGASDGDADNGFFSGVKRSLDEQAAAVEPIVTGAQGAVAIGKDDDIAGRMAELGAATQQDADRGDFGTAARRVLGTAAPFIAPGLGLVGAAMNKAEDYLADDAAPGIEAEAAQGQRDKTAKNFADNPKRALAGAIGGGLLTMGGATAPAGSAALLREGFSAAGAGAPVAALAAKVAPTAAQRALAAIPIGVAGSLNTSEGLDGETTAGRAALMGLLSAAGGAGLPAVADDVAMLASGARNVAGDVGDAAVKGAQGMRTAHPTPGASMVPDAVKKLARTGAAGLTGGKSEVALKVRDLLQSIAGKEAAAGPRGSSPSTLSAVKGYAAKTEPPLGPYSTKAPTWEPPTASSSGDDFVFNSPDDVAAANQSMAARVKGLAPGVEGPAPMPAPAPEPGPMAPDLTTPAGVAAASENIDNGLPAWMTAARAEDWGTRPRAGGLGFDGQPLPQQSRQPPPPELLEGIAAGNTMGKVTPVTLRQEGAIQRQAAQAVTIGDHVNRLQRMTSGSDRAAFLEALSKEKGADFAKKVAKAAGVSTKSLGLR